MFQCVAVRSHHSVCVDTRKESRLAHICVAVLYKENWHTCALQCVVNEYWHTCVLQCATKEKLAHVSCSVLQEKSGTHMYCIV